MLLWPMPRDATNFKLGTSWDHFCFWWVNQYTFKQLRIFFFGWMCLCMLKSEGSPLPLYNHCFPPLLGFWLCAPDCFKHLKKTVFAGFPCLYYECVPISCLWPPICYWMLHMSALPDIKLDESYPVHGKTVHNPHHLLYHS